MLRGLDGNISLPRGTTTSIRPLRTQSPRKHHKYTSAPSLLNRRKLMPLHAQPPPWHLPQGHSQRFPSVAPKPLETASQSLLFPPSLSARYRCFPPATSTRNNRSPTPQQAPRKHNSSDGGGDINAPNGLQTARTTAGNALPTYTCRIMKPEGTGGSQATNSGRTNQARQRLWRRPHAARSGNTACAGKASCCRRGATRAAAPRQHQQQQREQPRPREMPTLRADWPRQPSFTQPAKKEADKFIWDTKGEGGLGKETQATLTHVRIRT